MDYLDLDLHIGPPVRRAFQVSVDSPGVGGARGTMRRLNLDLELMALRVALLESDSAQPARRGVPSLVEEPARDLGRKLFGALFTGEVKAAYDAACTRARDKDGLRVRLTIDDPELMTIPWEFLWDPAQEEYLCLKRDVALVRYLPMLQPPPALPVSLPLKVLVLVSSPTDERLAKLDVRAEMDQITQALQPLIERQLVTIEWAKGDTVDDLEAAMRAAPNVFHFVGHGDFDTKQDEGGIFLSDRADQAFRLDATKLGRILAGRKQLRLVVLNACEGARSSRRAVFSSTAATLVRRGIPAVVAMQYKINDLAARRFAQQFYEHLAVGDPVDKAVTEARIGMDVEATTIEWGSPVLYMQSANGALFEVSRSAPPVAEPGPVAEPTPVTPPPLPAPKPPADPDTRHTLVVDPLRRGAFSSISAALAAAEPGDTIQVRPGYYAEALVIDKPVEIVGDAARDVTVKADGKSAIRFRASNARIANLTLRQGGMGAYYAVDIGGGRLILEGCDISSESNACVVIRAAADPRLTRNRIHHSRQGGVFCVDNALGVLEDNDIFANTFAGVTIKSGSNPWLIHNQIHDNQQTGVLVLDNGQGQIEDNEIFSNTFAGVAVKTGGNPAVRRNRIRDGSASGIYVHDGGRGTFEENVISGNAKAGVTITSSANPVLRRNQVRACKQRGVFVRNDGQGTLEENNIAENEWSGVEIRQGSRPTLRRNRIHDGKSVGLIVARNGLGLVEENEIYRNAADGVEIRSEANPTLRGNRIGPDNARGVFIQNVGRGILDDNDIAGNSGVGVEIRTGSNPTLRRNRVRNNKTVGIVLARNGLGLLDANEVSGNTLAGVEIRTGATPTLRNNRITANGGRAIWAHDAGGGTVENNDLRGNEAGAWDISADSWPNLKSSGNSE